MCLRERIGTCKGSSTALVKVDDAKWGIPPLQTIVAGNGMVLSAFGDTDNDGDVDMIGLVCFNDTENSEECSARLVFYENIAGSTPGTPPIWENRTTDYAKADLSRISTPGFTHTHTEYPNGTRKEVYTLYDGIPFSSSNPNVVVLVDYDGDGDLDLVFNNQVGYSINSARNIALSMNIGNVTHGKWNTTVDFATENEHGVSVPSRYNGFKTISFADLDNDGDLDFVAHGSGSAGAISYHENIGTRQSPRYKSYSRGLLLRDVQLVHAIPDYVRSVVLADVDNDGDYDLLIGSSGLASDTIVSGNIYIIENTGSRVEAAWTKRPSLEWIGFDTSSNQFDADVRVQQMVDLDLDGMIDFVYKTSERYHGVRAASSKMVFFRRSKIVGPTGFVARSEWALRDAGVRAEFANRYGEPDFLFGVDLNGDGHQDLVVGTKQDGIQYYEYEKIGNAGVEYHSQDSITTDGKNAEYKNVTTYTTVSCLTGNKYMHETNQPSILLGMNGTCFPDKNGRSTLATCSGKNVVVCCFFCHRI